MGTHGAQIILTFVLSAWFAPLELGPALGPDRVLFQAMLLALPIGGVLTTVVHRFLLQKATWLTASLLWLVKGINAVLLIMMLAAIPFLLSFAVSLLALLFSRFQSGVMLVFSVGA